MSFIPGFDNFGLLASLDKISGFKTVNKFGEATDCDNAVKTDIWDGADGVTSTDIWVPPTAARIHALVSSSTSDTNTAGTGARTIEVFGLQTWSTAESSETVILNGTTPVNTANSYVIIHRMIVRTWGSGGQNVGIIKATAATDATITAAILATQNQTRMAIYGVPSTQKLRINFLVADIIKGTGVNAVGEGELLIMRNADTYAAQNNTWTTIEIFTAHEGGIPWKHDFKPPKKADGPCIIKVQVTADTNNSTVISGFDAYIVDN